MDTWIAVGARGRGHVLIHNGHKYHLNKRNRNTIYWRCWRKQTCRANILTNLFDPTDDNPQINILSEEMDHTHDPDDATIDRNKFLNNAKKKIRENPTMPIKRVYDGEVAGVHQAAGQGRGDMPPTVPEFPSVRSQMSRTRNENIPGIPTNVEDVEFHGPWKKTLRGSKFLLHQDNHWGIAMFGTRQNIRNLAECDQLYMDDTFKTCPSPYHQMMVIQGNYHGRVLPFVTALMENRTVGDYRQVLQAVQHKVLRLTGHDWEPAHIVMDFEQAPLITAVETELQNTRVELCYFHFNQSLWRHIQELGLSTPYRRDERLKSIIRKVSALGFLPVALVRNNLALLRNARRTRRKMQQYPALTDFFNYVHNTYIAGQFPPPAWNVFERNMDCRTNNNAESFHSTWNKRVDVRHPNLWLFISHLKNLQASTESGVQNMDRGGNPLGRKRKWRLLEARLVSLKDEYIQGVRDISRYWRAVSHLLHHF